MPGHPEQCQDRADDHDDDADRPEDGDPVTKLMMRPRRE
jgi:hypothetical protein